MTVRVVLLHRHKVIAEALSILLKMHKEIELVGISDGLADVADLCRDCEPDVLVADAHRNDPEFFQGSASDFSKIPIVWMEVDPHELHQVALGKKEDVCWISAKSSLDDLLLAIRAAASGRRYVCPLSSDAAGIGKADLPSGLGGRESQVLRLIADGYSSKEIARNLHIAPSTVDVHRRNIMRKVGLHKVADLTRYAIRHQMVSW